METKKYTRLSMLLALAVVLSIIESVIPFLNGYILGLKLGLANIVVLMVLYMYSHKEAMYISILRVILVGILVTGIFNIMFFFSLSGAIFSLIAMALIKRYTKLSIIGVSIIGSIFHSLGQILIAIIFLKTFNIIYYLPFLLIFSIPTGIVTGLLSKELLRQIKY